MDFFAEQDRALKRSGWLWVVFLLGVAGVVLVVYLITAALFVVTDHQGNAHLGLGVHELGAGVFKKSWFHPQLFFFVTAGVLGIIVISYFSKARELTAGGANYLAISMGGDEVSPDTRDFRERVLLNVVEEMSLASGHPMPRVFVLRAEQAINAFAAATGPKDIVVGVTRGALEKLSRDELQGVMAHEMSHLVYGDSVLNVRMISLVFGLLGLTVAGRVLLELGARSARSRDGASLALLVLVLGLVFYLVGLVSVLFGRILQAAINRQREYLADASAVQYTRNPLGIAGALKKVGGFSSKASLAGHAQDTAHMMFCDPLKHWFGSLLASHPPLIKRIKKLDPQFTGHIDAAQFSPPLTQQDAVASDFVNDLSTEYSVPAAVSSGTAREQFRCALRGPDLRHFQFARARTKTFSSRLRDAVRDPAAASAVCLMLVFSPDVRVRRAQRELLLCRSPAAVALEARRLENDVDSVPRSERLWLADLTVPALRQLSAHQARELVELLDELVAMDGITDLLEFALQQMVRRHLLAYHRLVPPPLVRHRPPSARLSDEYGIILSALAHAENRDEKEARAAFDKVLRNVEYLSSPPVFFSRADCTWPRLVAALDELAASAPDIRKNLLFCAAEIVLQNNTVSLQEWELVRAIADAIDLPLPPLLLENVFIRHSAPGSHPGV